jgi:hypothetical protein
MLNYAELRKLLAQDKLAKLVEMLHAATARLDQDLNNQVVTIAGRLTRVNTQLNTGQISHEEANQERSRVSAALLDIINQLQSDYPAAQQHTGYQQQQQRVRQATPPQQSRPVWPYILLGVVVSIVVLGIIGNMMESDSPVQPVGFDSGTVAEKTVSPAPQPARPTGGSTGEASKFTDEKPASNESASTGYSAADLVGAWEFSLSQEGGQVLAHLLLNSDGTCQSQVYLNSMLLPTESGTWRLEGSMFYQTSSTSTEVSRLTWINRNQFRLTNPQEGVTIVLSRME